MSASNVFLALLCASASLFAFLGLAAMGRRTTPGAKSFAYLMSSAAVYIGALALSFSAGSLEGGLTWLKVSYFGFAPMPALWFLFVRSFTGRPRLGIASALLLFAPPIATIAVAWAGGLEGLLLSAVSFRLRGSLIVIASSPGPWSWLFTAYSAALAAWMLIMLIGSLGRNAPGHKARTFIVILGSCFPIVSAALRVADIRPLGLDMEPVALDLSGLCLGIALLRHDLFQVAFIGRERVIEALEDGIVLVDPVGRIADANPSARRLLGLGEEPVGELLAAYSRAAPLACLAAGGSEGIEFDVEAEGGSRRLSARASLVEGSRGERVGTALIVSDVSENAALLARLTELAVTDELTGLTNRRSFLEKARREFGVAQRAGRPMAVAILDLDRFKAVNDDFGHPVGDAVLAEASARMLKRLRGGDSLCRYGGEEFAVLMPETDAEGALTAAEGLRGAVGKGPVKFEGGSVLVTASAGIYGAPPEPGERLEDFLARADAALYWAKEAGRNRSAPWLGVRESRSC
jgi:diguanylate cyclase (GGDEF)-like protein